MQSFYAEQFVREMGCTEQEWLGWLDAAMGDVVWQKNQQNLEANLYHGNLKITWQVGPERKIALMRMPVLKVTFSFSHVSEAQRYAFMKRFDLYMQRGGG